MGWIRSERGASLIEWAMLVVLIAIVALIALKFVGAQNSDMWSEIGQFTSLAAARRRQARPTCSLPHSEPATRLL